jgi:hypothetical protein
MTSPTWARRVLGWCRRRPVAPPPVAADEWEKTRPVDVDELHARHARRERDRERDDRRRWIDRHDGRHWL